MKSDPDLGKIGPGHVCKHGIRWPHACEPCDEAAYQAHVAARPRYLADHFEWAAPGDRQEDVWLVRFDDQDIREMVFTGPDAEAEAWAAWERHAPGYNIHIFRQARLKSECGTQKPTFQPGVAAWMQECFGPTISADKLERGDRFLEEVFELLQSGDYPPERVLALRDYVWGRPKGEPYQEVGGTMVTLAAYCLAFGLDMHESADIELARIVQPAIIEKIREKQWAKPTGSALPVAQPPECATRDAEIERLTAELRRCEEWFARVRPATDEANHYLNEDGWDDMASIHDAARTALSNKDAG